MSFLLSPSTLIAIAHWLILVAIIIFVRPEDLPKLVRTIGRYYGELQTYMHKIRRYTRDTADDLSRIGVEDDEDDDDAEDDDATEDQTTEPRNESRGNDG